jgi:hypothetical protein
LEAREHGVSGWTGDAACGGTGWTGFVGLGNWAEGAQSGRMKKKASPRADAVSGLAKQGGRGARAGRIHPVVIYPFRPPSDYADLEELYRLVARLAGEGKIYARPITVLDRKTSALAQESRAFERFQAEVVACCSDVLESWSVDTCQMWYAGLGMAFDRGRPGDVYWLIPGDFNYGTPVGKGVLGRLHDLPEICLELNQDLCVGEISVEGNHPKQLIDTYGTFALMYNWFPAEAAEIRQYTERPRSEFFALNHGFLQDLLQRRWYAYEQTVVTLLHAVFNNRRISRFVVGQISDLPGGRESLASALQQVERTERVLKSVWRERHETRADWVGVYRELEGDSEQIRRAASVVLRNLLG